MDIFTFLGRTLWKNSYKSTRENKVSEAELSGKGYGFFISLVFAHLSLRYSIRTAWELYLEKRGLWDKGPYTAIFHISIHGIRQI